MRDAARQILRMMYGDDEREAPLHQALQQPLHRSSLPRIESGQRFVQQQNACLARERAREQRTTQLTVRQLPGAALRNG